MTVRADVEAALLDEFETFREIWNRVGRWAPSSVRHALEALRAEGKAERKGKPQSGVKIVYRRRP